MRVRISWTLTDHVDGKRASRHLTRSLAYDWPLDVSNADFPSSWICKRYAVLRYLSGASHALSMIAVGRN